MTGWVVADGATLAEFTVVRPVNSEKVSAKRANAYCFLQNNRINSRAKIRWLTLTRNTQ